MIDYREILRWNSLGTSQRGIAREVQSGRDTVAKVLAAAQAAGISWPLDDDVNAGLRPDPRFIALVFQGCDATSLSLIGVVVTNLQV